MIRHYEGIQLFDRTCFSVGSCSLHGLISDPVTDIYDGPVIGVYIIETESLDGKNCKSTFEYYSSLHMMVKIKS